MSITKPCLAATIKSVDELNFTDNHYLATYKLDGIRALKISGKLVSRTFKPIRNNYIRGILEKLLPDGADGEIVINSNNFQDTSSGVMSADGEPEFTYYWFDYVKDSLDKEYKDRMKDIKAVFNKEMAKFVIPLLPTAVHSKDELAEFEAESLAQGFEGVILRTPNGPYKCGRSTMKEQYLMKLKRFQDDEAIVIGFEERMHNDNDAEKDNFGRTKRSSANAGMVAVDTLGALLVRDIKTGLEFSIGTGFDDDKRKEIWTHKKQTLGKIAIYKHFAISGVKDKPRFPVFKGFRDKEDM